MTNIIYDNSSVNGNRFNMFYDEENNPQNPPSDMGWFIYNLYGKSFDYLYNHTFQMWLNSFIVTCEDSYLNTFGIELQCPRDPEWFNDEYRTVLFTQYYNHQTLRGLEHMINLILGIQNDNVWNSPCNAHYWDKNFVVSTEYDIQSLTSSEYELNDLLTEDLEMCVVIDVDERFNLDLVYFVQDYILYCTIINPILR